MDIENWLSEFAVVAENELNTESARELIAYVNHGENEATTLIETRKWSDWDLIILEVQTESPQSPHYPINLTEIIGVLFWRKDRHPLVVMLRNDFPDTEHQFIVDENSPRAICIDNRSWIEAVLTWTPSELIRRILSWLKRAAFGELHDAGQPLEPNMQINQYEFLIQRSLAECFSSQILVGITQKPPDNKIVNVVSINELHQENLTWHDPQSSFFVNLISYSVKPENMKRLTHAPNSLVGLAGLLKDREIDLFTDLRERVSMWFGDSDSLPYKLDSDFAIIVNMPILAPDGGSKTGVDVRAFTTTCRARDVAVALGVAIKSNPRAQSASDYVLALIPGEIDWDAIGTIKMTSAGVHFRFDRKLATQLTDRAEEDRRQVVLVGAGAIGSHIADCLTREGRFTWTVIDHDYLLPHNLARHIGRKSDITKRKAEIVAGAINSTIDDEGELAQSIFANVTTVGSERKRIDEAIENADLVIDATASPAASRYLSDHKSKTRRVSAFFNPTGSSAVLFAEPKDRSLKLRDIEAQYYGLLVRDDGLEKHLAEPTTFTYTGACSAITNKIPQSSVMALSGLVSSGLTEAIENDFGIIKVWSMAENGATTVHELKPEPATSYLLQGWTITIDEGLAERMQLMRDKFLPNETGGVLTGLLDIQSKSIYIVNASPQPKDSICSPHEFKRGLVGVDCCIEEIQKRTLNQLRYIGEWHSHPPLRPTKPSQIDLEQISELRHIFSIDNLPALMLIVGDREIGINVAHNESDPDFRCHKMSSGSP